MRSRPRSCLSRCLRWSGLLLPLAAAWTLPFAASAAEPATSGKRGKGGNPEGAPLRRTLPATVKVERDLVYARYGSREVMLDLYLPRQPASDRIPCIVAIHGGGWRSGDKTRFAAQAAHLADHGFAAACIGYRLLPEVTFPAPIVDCKAAVAMATPADMARFAQRSGVDARLVALISPVTHVGRESAPTLLLHSDADRTVPYEQSELLWRKLQASSVETELVKIPGAPHAFWNGDPWFNGVMARTTDFFRTHLGR